MRRSEIPSLDDLRAFEATARLGSVRSAADSLALTHGAVSRRITKVARDLGFELFEKSGRGLRLTKAGETLNLTLGRFFGELTETIAKLRRASTQQVVVVLSCEPSVAMRWLIPRLATFEAAFPHLALHLSVGGGPIDFRRDRIDLAIRRLDFSIPEAWHIERIFAEEVGPVLSPGLLPAFEQADYVALGSKTRPNAWSDWLSAHPSHHRPREIRYFDHHFLMIEATLAGLGVGLSPRVLTADDVSRARLVAPSGFDPDGSSYGLLWPAEVDSTMWAPFVQWLNAELSASFA
jgi:DNA-binding transcriptional LysR family regulator